MSIYGKEIGPSSFEFSKYSTEIIIGVVRSLNGLNFVSTDQPLGAYQNEVSSLSECDKIR